MTALRQLIEQAEAGQTVGLTMPREWWLQQLNQERRSAVGDDLDNWVSLTAAATLMGRKPSTVRAAAPRWARMTDPPVRVRKAGPAAGSPWLFHEGDCWRYRRETGGGPRPESVTTGNTAPGGVDIDEREATRQHWATLAYQTTETACPGSRSRQSRKKKA